MSILDDLGKKDKRKGHRGKGFEALGDIRARLAATPGALPEAPIAAAPKHERVAHSLSSAATNEPPSHGEEIPEHIQKAAKEAVDVIAQGDPEYPREGVLEASRGVLTTAKDRALFDKAFEAAEQAAARPRETPAAEATPAEAPAPSEPEKKPQKNQEKKAGSEAKNERAVRIDGLINDFFAGVDDGKDPDETYRSILGALPQKDKTHFKKRLTSAAHNRGLDIDFPKDAPPAAPPEDTPAQKKIPEWSRLLRQNRGGDGSIGKSKFWRGEKGAAYVDLGGSVPRRVAHGERIRYTDPATREKRVAFWDQAAGNFTDTDPAPKARAEGRPLKRERDAERKRIQGERLYSPDKLKALQEKMTASLENIEASDATRQQFQQGIAAIRSIKDARALGELLRSRPQKAGAPVAAPAPRPAAASESAKRPIDNSPYTPERLAQVQGNLAERLKTLKIKADQFMDIGERIYAAKNAEDIRKISREIGALEPKETKTSAAAPDEIVAPVVPPTIVAAPAASPAKSDGANSLEENQNLLKRRIQALPKKKFNQQDREALSRQLNVAKTKEQLEVFERYLKEVEDGTPSNPGAKGIRSADVETGVLKKVGNVFYIKSGNLTRTATAEEIAAYNNLKETITRASKPDKSRPHDTGAETFSGNMRDTYREDMYEATGVTHEDIKRRLEARLAPRVGPTGPKIRQTRELDGSIRENVVRDVEERVLPPSWDVDGSEFFGITPKTVREILRSRPDALNFGALIESLDPGGLEIMRKSIADEPLTAQERKLLNFTRYEYARRIKQIEFINERITTNDLQTVARRDPDFAAALGLNGAERTALLFKGQVVQMGMKNREALDRLFNTYQNLSQLRDSAEYREWESEIHALCDESGTAVNDFDQVFDFRTPELRLGSEMRLAQRFRESQGSFMSLIESVVPVSELRAGSFMRRARDLNDVLKRPHGTFADIDKELKTLTAVLKYTVTDNPQVIHMLEQESFRDANLIPPHARGPYSFEDTQKEKEKAPKAASDIVAEHMKQFRTADGRDWDHSSALERAESAGALERRELSAEREQGTGWFARAMASFFRSLFGNELKSAINRPVLAH